MPAQTWHCGGGRKQHGLRHPPEQFLRLKETTAALSAADRMLSLFEFTLRYEFEGFEDPIISQE